MNWKIISTLAAAGCLFASAAMADPSVKLSGNTFTIEESLTDDIAAEIKKQESNVKDMGKLAFTLEKIKNEDLAKICSLYPDMNALKVKSKEVTDLAPVAKLGKLNTLELDVNTSDFSPLAGLSGLTKINVSSPNMGADLTWMNGLTALKKISVASESGLSLKGLPSLPQLDDIKIKAPVSDLTPLVEAMPGLKKIDLTAATLGDLTPLTKLENLKELNFYGATVKDFSPLAACPKLESLNYYATKDADYSTLGKLVQIVELNGGLTKLDDISWVANLPNLRKFDVFAEYVTDYSPLTQTKIEEFQIWNMRVPVGDLGEVGKVTSLKDLTLWDVQEASNSKALAGLTNLEKIAIQGYNNKKGTEPFDLSAAAGWGKVKEARLDSATFINSSGMEAMGALAKLRISKANINSDQALDLAFLGKLANLSSLDITESKVANFDSIANCNNLSFVSITKTEGITSLAPLKNLPALKQLIVSKDSFPAAELEGFGPDVKITQK